MRNQLSFFMGLILVFSCGKPGPEPEPQPEPQPQITIPSESQAVFNDGISLDSGESDGEDGSSQIQTSTVKFTASSSWSAEVNDTRSSNWLSVQPVSGGAGDVTMIVTAQPNTNVESRSVSVTIKCGVFTLSFTVTQAGAPPAVVDVESVTLDKTDLNLEPGDTYTLISTVEPENATDKTVIWNTSNAEVCTVEDGKVVAIKAGEAVITAKSGDKSATCNVTVMKHVVVTSITLNKTSLSLTKGQEETLTATVAPDDATDKTITWSSSDATVASVTQGGLVKAMKSGTATITAKAGEKSATCNVSITTPVESISLNKTSVSLNVGKKTKLTATINPNDADDKTVLWSSSDNTVASVVNGEVTAMGQGSCVITAKAGGKSATCEVTVDMEPGGDNEDVGYDDWVVAVESISLNQSSVSLDVGRTATLVATINPSNADDKNITWISSNKNVATVKDGLVTAVNKGTCVITAKAGGRSATCEVTVAMEPGGDNEEVGYDEWD